MFGFQVASVKAQRLQLTTSTILITCSSAQHIVYVDNTILADFVLKSQVHFASIKVKIKKELRSQGCIGHPFKSRTDHKRNDAALNVSVLVHQECFRSTWFVSLVSGQRCVYLQFRSIVSRGQQFQRIVLRLFRK